MILDQVFETALYVTDLKAAQSFYEELLAASAFAVEPGRHVFFKLEHGMLLLFNPGATLLTDTALPPHGTTGAGHVAFRVEPNELQAWRDQLIRLNVAVEKEWS